MGNKYSFYQFLTQEVELISNNDETSSVIIDKITIPMIQRDYAQGRTANNQEEVLNPAGQKFIEEIFSVLTSENASKELELDFIYGSISVEETEESSSNKEITFFPLDGQQRLTTLFLLYWFVGGAELSEIERNNLAGVLKNFAYATRTSSTAFCENLVSELKHKKLDYKLRSPEEKNSDGVVIKPKEDITTQLENLCWFHDSYKLDPTIMAMLNMLNQIQKLYVDSHCNSVFLKLEKLCFYVLPLSNFGLTEDLYVKMNARGKQLTNLENFKADLQDWIKANEENCCLEEQDYDGRMIPYDMFFVNKIDNEWSECLWAIQKESTDKNFDPLLMSFIFRFMLNEYILNSTAANKTLDKEKDFIRLCDESTYATFSVFSKYLNKDILERLSTVLDRITKNYTGIEDVIQPCWLSSEYRFEVFKKEKYELKERVVFCAIILYLIKNDFNRAKMSDWIHVVWNIVENANIDSWRVTIGVIQLIKELIVYSDDIYGALADDQTRIDSLQSKDTIAEERKKAKLRQSDSAWAAEFLVAERHPFFRGSISFLIPEDDSLNGFKHNRDMSYLFFDEKGVSEKYRNDHLFLRALLSRYSTLSEIKYHITDKAEKENSLKNMLSSDPVVRKAIREWFALNTENDIYERLIEEVHKDSPIPVTTNDFEKKLHELLYKKTELISWMQEKSAIRYRDNYISRPNSSYDWLFVYGYANEIIDALVNRGWVCKNKCYIGEQKVIPFYWTAAGREIDVSKVVETTDGRQLLARCSVGKEEIQFKLDDSIIERYPYLEQVTNSTTLSIFVQDLENRIAEKTTL